MTDVDCIAVCENEKVRSVTYRHLTVSYAGRHRDNVYTPAVIMKGLWLEAAGFTVGAKVDVQVMWGCILLITRQPPKELKIKASLELAAQLAAGKKKKLGVNLA